MLKCWQLFDCGRRQSRCPLQVPVFVPRNDLQWVHQTWGSGKQAVVLNQDGRGR